MQRVTIIGAGMAGLTAALRLAERGYKVTLFERDSFVGGKFRATEWKGKDTKRSVFHEHSYHMFLNWYHNFWQIVKEVGALHDFIPMTKVKFLHQGHFPKTQELENFGAPSAVLQNLRSGVLSAPDMFLYMYSVVDLLSTPMGQDRYRDLISVNAFASTKAYSTEASVSMYDEYLAKTFAVASYESSAKTFQTFLEYGAYCPDPLYWSLTGDCYNHFLHKLLLRIKRLGVDVRFNHNIMEIDFDASGNASRLKLKRYDESFSPTVSQIPLDRFERDNKSLITDETYDLEGSLIIAVPHSVLADLLLPEFLNRDLDLGDTAKLRSIPMASVHLHFKDSFAERLEHMDVTLPPEPVVLVDSKYKLSFVANSSLWPDAQGTYLNVVASDSRPLNNLSGAEVFMDDRQWYQGPGARISRLGHLSIDAPKSPLDYILNEFRRFVPFELEDIDVELLHIDRNVGRELFMNDVGSWKWRPETRTKVRNIFLAGDYCKNFIDVVSLEGAVVSGLQAAECVRRRDGMGSEIGMTRPKKYPVQVFWPLKLAMTPYAVAAKLWCAVDDMMRGTDR